MTAPPGTAQAALAHASALLFVPATRPERLAKALASGAGAVIVDLEDAVASADKAAARDAFAQAFEALAAAERGRVLLRINAAATPWHADDIALAARCVAQGLVGVVLPKAESARVLADLAGALGPQAALLPLVESGAGLDALDALATAPQVLRLVFGHLDFQLDLGMACADDEAELLPVRLALVRASRRAGLAAPVDGVTVATGDAPRLAADAARARRMGFGGKLCIHPAQVAGVRAAFAPSQAELDWARRVMAGVETHGDAAFSLDGRMVDAPVVTLARRTLGR
ncbi:MAG: CoA ester lyase [Ramlibacter sp.]